MDTPDSPPAVHVPYGTQADEIAAQFGNNSYQHSNGEGRSLTDVLWERSFTIQPAEDGSATRYTFVDGSVITLAGEHWFIGFSDCYCDQSKGHRCGQDV